MTVYYYSGFDITEHYPDFALNNIDDGSVTFSVSGSDLSISQLSHLTLAGVLGSTWSDLASELQSAINSAASTAGSSLTWTVTYDTSTARYTISADGTWSFDTTADSRALLGAEFGIYSSITTRTLGRTPEQVIVSTIPGRSQVTDDYEPGDVASQAIADAGGTNVQGIARTAALTYQDWRQEFEPKTACFSRAATDDVPWTYQDMVQHCRTVWPLRIVDDSASEDFVGYLRQGGAAWSRDVIERAAADYDKHWHVNLRMYLAGRP